MASGHRLFKLCTGTFAAGVVTLVGVATEARAQAPDEDWRTLTTDHLRVTFPQRLEPLGRRSAGLAEIAYAGLVEVLLEPPAGRIDLLLTDHADVSNGFAQVTPSNRITVFVQPPVDALSLGYFDDWLELVITHEMAHVIHLDHTGTTVGRLLRKVFGRAPAEWLIFLGLA